MAKNCEGCGKELSLRNSFLFKGSSVCKDCLAKLESGEGKEGFTTKTQEESTTLTSITAAPYQFKTLLGYSKFISGLGWVVIIIGVIAIIGGLASGSEVGVGVAGGSLIFIILGIGMIASGQLMSCFVSIERNTRATYELLKQNQK